MIEQDLAIEPPPSLEAILSHRERIGRVDFTHRLMAPPPPRDATGTGEVAAGPPAEETDVPDAAPTDIADTPAEVAEPARRDPEAADLQATETQAAETQAAETRAAGTQADDAEAAAGATSTDEPEDDFLVAPPTADLATADAGDETSAQVAALLSLVPAEDVETVTEDVDEVVEGVLARIREVRSATLAHLEAIEVEAALRCEMLTAQAELDAELIRLHARREAHAILAAARARSGMPNTGADDVRRLDHLGRAASRLVESLEEPGPTGSPDHPFLP